ncbi:MAG: hypothetical protein BGO82_03360 [Devosia sp. 67-54]|uniref:hypothetical protein n=1 Tax=unclassified Devosia TaxID=196773 RepID=UPI00095DC330|nr:MULTISPECIES: hypothetical protein [unclassified Devosia]MBN9305508.1 hypothetical protein [Devosia sp.]OJX19093.1 MAG: hypothetical protein BGO82_03360 [Devosia sp. 67-54]
MTSRLRTRLLVGLALAAGVALFAAANTHLIWTSVLSQPDCVPHLKAPGPAGGYQAAQSSC